MNPSNNKADGVGFGIDQVNPLRNFLAKVQEHLDPDSFIELQNRLQDKLSRKALSRVDAIDDPTQRKATFFKELEKNFDIILTIRILKAATKQMQLTLTEEWTQYIADLCDEHLQLYQEHIHSCEALGLKVNENFVGREKYLTDILKDFRDPQPSTIAGVMISGMYGMGKTSLASHICWKLAPTHNIIKINFKNKRTPKEFYWAVLGAFGEPIEGEINTVLLQKIITSCNQETILYLDDLDDLMNTTRAGYSVSYFRQVCNMLRAIAEVNPRKVKMLLTSRFKMVPAEEDQVLVQNYRTERLQGTFREYQLNPMELEECLELIDKEAKSLGLLEDEKSKLAESCGFSPFALGLTISYLRDSEYSIKHYLSLTPATPESPSPFPRSPFPRSPSPRSPSVGYAMNKFFKDISVKTLMDNIFKDLGYNWRKRLLQLSVFEDEFDTESARFVMGDATLTDAVLKLQVFEGRHLLETRNTTKALSVNRYDEEAVRYSMHTLTLNYLKRRQSKDEWRAVITDAEDKFCAHYQKVLLSVAESFRKNVLQGLKLYEEGKTHFKKLQFLQNKNNVYAPVAKAKEFKLNALITQLFERFLLEDERIVHFQTQARIAVSKGDILSECYYKLWEAETHFSDERLDLISDIIIDIDKKLTVLEKEHTIPKKNLKTSRAFHDIVKGRWLYRMQKQSDSLEYLTKGHMTYTELLGPCHPNTSKVCNLIGSVYFSMGDFQKSHKFHAEAYRNSVRISVDNLNFDLPVYLMNIGTAFHKLAQQSDELGEEKLKKERYSEAKAYYQRSINLYRTLNMYGYSSCVHTLRNLLYLLSETNQLKEAKEWTYELKDICRTFLSEKDPIKVNAIYMQGHIFFELGKKLKRKQHEEKARRHFKIAEREFDDALRHVLMNDFFPVQNKDFANLQKDYVALLKLRGKADKHNQIRKAFEDYLEKRAGDRDCLLSRIKISIPQSEEESDLSDDVIEEMSEVESDSEEQDDPEADDSSATSDGEAGNTHKKLIGRKIQDTDTECEINRKIPRLERLLGVTGNDSSEEELDHEDKRPLWQQCVTM